MAVNKDSGVLDDFEGWYKDTTFDDDGSRRAHGLSQIAVTVKNEYEDFKREMDARCKNMWKFELLADNEVVSPKADLANVSSGETAGIVRRIARNLVQNVPNVDVLSRFDDQSMEGILSRHILMTKIIGVEEYSNDMQQNLFASTKTGLTTGFDCVVPVLLQRPDGSWYVKYDTIHYRDVFPEPTAKDVRDALVVYIRRYMSKGQIQSLIRNQTPGWDISALLALLKRNPVAPPKDPQSNSVADRRKKITASGYQVITRYDATGQDFLTFSADNDMLLRMEQNKHPNHEHPVNFLILEKDSQHPLGKSQVDLLYGRQEFQDLIHNGAMKLWYKNLNPPIIGYGAPDAVPNLGPGKYTKVSNPNARLEAFEVNTQTLLQYPALAQGNLGSMVNLVGSADQQMAVQAGSGMSATPQGVDAQEKLVDITTNNYQKAIESFFSHYCSYALTIFFQELKAFKGFEVQANTRHQLLDAGFDETLISDDSRVEVDMSAMAVQYYVRTVPGSLVEMEDEKQLRILNQLFVPLSQAMPALAASQNPQVVGSAAAAMQFIIERQIEISGADRSHQLKKIFKEGNTPETEAFDQRALALEERIGLGETARADIETQSAAMIASLQSQIALLAETQGVLMEKLGVPLGQPTQENSGTNQQLATTQGPI